MQITDIAEVRVLAKETPAATAAAPVTSSPAAAPAPAPAAAKPTAPSDELICLDSAVEANTSKLDGFSLDDLNDDDFNPRAEGGTSGGSEDDDEGAAGGSDDAPPPSMPAPQIIRPPPAAPARPAPAVVGEQAKVNMTISNDLFAPKDANDPFAKNPFASSGGGSNDPFGMASFSSSAVAANPSPKSSSDSFQAGLTSNTFSLDQLDPLKK